jgi:hypothetical protein
MNLMSAAAPREPFEITSTTLTATVSGDTYTATYSETPNTGTVTFAGQMATSSAIDIGILKNGGLYMMERATSIT